jgi:hypothetical protein
MIKLELTQEEANALANVIDLAIKAGGVRTATAAMPIFQKLEQAANQPKDAEQ